MLEQTHEVRNGTEGTYKQFSILLGIHRMEQDNFSDAIKTFYKLIAAGQDPVMSQTVLRNNRVERHVVCRKRDWALPIVMDDGTMGRIVIGHVSAILNVGDTGHLLVMVYDGHRNKMTHIAVEKTNEFIETARQLKDGDKVIVDGTVRNGAETGWYDEIRPSYMAKLELPKRIGK